MNRRKNGQVFPVFIFIVTFWAIVIISFQWFGVSGMGNGTDPYGKSFDQSSGLEQLWDVMTFQADNVSVSLSIFLNFMALISIVTAFMLIRGSVS